METSFEINNTVSVIMCNYNNAQYIDRAIKSILAQKTDFKIEVLLCDDGSTDNSIDVFNKYLSLSTRKITLLPFFRSHKGLMMNYMNAFSNCNGKYIVMLDTDDYWINSERLKLQSEYMESNPDCGLCITKVYTEINGIRHDMNVSANHVNKNMSFDSLLKGKANIYAQSYMIRKSDFDKYINFDKLLKFNVWDYPIVLELIQHTRFHCLDFYSAVYTKNNESVTNTKNRKNRIKYKAGTYKIRLYYIFKYGCKTSTILYLIYRFVRDTYSIIFKRW